MPSARTEKGKKRTSRSKSKKLVPQKSKSPKNNRLAKKKNTGGRRGGKGVGYSNTNKTRSKTRANTIAKTSSSPSSSPRKNSTKSTTPAATKNTVVRIMGHGQYRVDPQTMAKVNEIDNEIVKLFDGSNPSSSLPQNGGKNVVEGDDINSRFQAMLEKMSSIITNNGEQLSHNEIVPSDLMIPPVGTPIEEARELFKGEGLFPG